MAWFPVPVILPSTRKGWLMFIIAIAVSLVASYFLATNGYFDFLDKKVSLGSLEASPVDIYNFLFWIGFIFFWGLIAITIIQLIFEKVKGFFSKG
jgi:hypothetical protein